MQPVAEATEENTLPDKDHQAFKRDGERPGHCHFTSRRNECAALERPVLSRTLSLLRKHFDGWTGHYREPVAMLLNAVHFGSSVKPPLFDPAACPLVAAQLGHSVGNASPPVAPRAFGSFGRAWTGPSN